MLAGVPPASARSMSSAFAASTSSDAASSASAIACSARSFWARVASASPWLAVRARSAACSTGDCGAHGAERSHHEMTRQMR